MGLVSPPSSPKKGALFYMMATKKTTTKKTVAKKAAARKKPTTKKAATKKTAAKKEAKKRERTAAICAPDLGFDILDKDSDVLDNAAQVLSSVVGRRKNQTIGFASAIDIKKNVLPIPEFQLQYLMGIVGIPHGSFLEIIATESMGKTTLALTLAGWALDAGAPVVYCECEGKQMPNYRMIRCMDKDPKRGAKKLQQLKVERISSLEHLDQFLTDYADVMRGRKALKDHPVAIPHHVPLVVIVDPWSRLMNQAEASKFYDYGKNMAPSNKLTPTATGSNFGHAKFAQAWCRRLAYMLEHDNMILVLCQHQNEDLKSAMAGSMGGGPKIVLPESFTTLENVTHLGGRAPKQLATQMWTMGKRGVAKYHDKTNNGDNINLCMAKNSFGPQKRKMFFEIRNEHRGDIPGVFIEPALQFAQGFASWFTRAKYLGSKQDTSGDTYSCEDLGVRAVSAEEFHQAFHENKEMRELMGRKLEIEGYVDTVQRIEDDIVARDTAEKERAKMAKQGESGPAKPNFEVDGTEEKSSKD